METVQLHKPFKNALYPSVAVSRGYDTGFWERLVMGYADYYIYCF